MMLETPRAALQSRQIPARISGWPKKLPAQVVVHPVHFAPQRIEVLHGLRANQTTTAGNQHGLHWPSSSGCEFVVGRPSVLTRAYDLSRDSQPYKRFPDIVDRGDRPGAAAQCAAAAM